MTERDPAAQSPSEPQDAPWTAKAYDAEGYMTQAATEASHAIQPLMREVFDLLASRGFNPRDSQEIVAAVARTKMARRMTERLQRENPRLNFSPPA